MNKRTRIYACLTSLAVGIGLTGAAMAQVKPEDSIKLRKAAFALIGYNFSSLGAMSQDRKPYNKDEAIRNAEAVAALARMPLEHFGAGTDKGDTKAKPEVWSQMDKFRGLMGKMNEETAKLAQVARNGDLAALKVQFGETGKSCKACHDDYRAK
jgi:cytochrome c556